ncbi:hypothetical protein RJ639_012672 [Escallonia herrerae]|uniref:AAA+ ATPase At3g28540-like C-terminal domain-containing protein n=1 Tax=Escallonia herrerae TaxID=1293975 RepID=A0AA89AR34_9ASTE|nr:hypothetical protein RJ639_012672 [Escallonia herrerae]
MRKRKKKGKKDEKEEGFKLLARNYLDVGAHHVFDKIRALLEEVDMTPTDVAENSMPKSAEVMRMLVWGT